MLKYYGPGISWALFIFILCAIPGKNLPHYSWADLLSVDKLVHFTMFFVLTVLFKRGFVQQAVSILSSKQDVILVLSGILYGGSLELMQSYFYIDRSGSWFDFLSNSLGAIAGVYFFKRLFDEKGNRLFFR